ncbi:MAG: sulfotransferase [Actinomycetota bacterium]|nr:sulfotransferase [Actinomycetota bacterium]
MLPDRLLHVGRFALYPDFLIIGAQKAGTTWLHRNLQTHPRIWMPKEKELHYFDEKVKNESSLVSRLRGERAMDERWRRQLRRQLGRYDKEFSLRNLMWDLNYFFRPYNDKWYASLFRQGRGKVTGEATPDYSIIDGAAVAHVHEIMPKARIIFMMRNPIERMWSQALMDYRMEVSPEKINEEIFLRHFDGRRPRLFSDYRRTLENWGSFYPHEQIFVGFLEDVHFYPNRLLKRLYRFLGVETGIDYKVIRRKIHSRDVQTMPTKLAVYLARVYREDLGLLSERFGGYASFWRYCAERLIEEPPEEEQIPYPLWESPLWEEWVAALGEEPAPGTRQAEVRSGPLPQVWSVGW